MSEILHIMEKDIKEFSILQTPEEKSYRGNNNENACYINTCPQPQDVEAPSRIDCYAVYLFEDGNITVRCNLKEMGIKAKCVLFCPPGTVLQTIHHTETRCAVCYFHRQLMLHLNVSVLRILPYTLELGEAYTFAIDDNSFHLLWQQMETAERSIGQDPTLLYYHESTQASIQALAYNIMSLLKCHLEKHQRYPAQKSVKHEEDIFQHFITLVNQYHTRERFISFYAEQMHLTPKYLSNIIRRASGHGPAEWINQNVLLEAKNLLKFTDKSIQEVAYALNFPNQSFFGRWFKTQTSLSPKEYRNRG